MAHRITGTLLDPIEQRVRITKRARTGRVAVSGALPYSQAQGRLARLLERVPDEGYELTPVAPPTPTDTTWKARR